MPGLSGYPRHLFDQHPLRFVDIFIPQPLSTGFTLTLQMRVKQSANYWKALLLGQWVGRLDVSQEAEEAGRDLGLILI